MTGLDPTTDSILSLACYITDARLHLVDEKGYEAIIHHSSSRLESMNTWCIETHGQSGLTQMCLGSSTTAEQAADGLLNYIIRYCPERGKALLAGNSVHADKSFLMHKPYEKVLQHLHYRMLDVSSIKEGLRRWAPPAILQTAPKKKGLHEARADILESIEEARWMQSLVQGMRTS